MGKIPWRRKWQPTSVFLPGKSHELRSLVGHSPWGHKEWDMTEQACIYDALLLLLLLSRLRSCPTLCNSIDGSPPDSPVPGILQARTLEWVAISFSNAWKWKVKSESEVAQSCPTLSIPVDCSPQAPPSMGFSRQEYWSGVPLPSLLWCTLVFNFCFQCHLRPCWTDLLTHCWLVPCSLKQTSLGVNNMHWLWK